MMLHEFMVNHRDEILQVCHQKVRHDVMDTAEIVRDVETFFDEIVQALRYHDGLADQPSSLPGKSETAARLGQGPQRAGIQPAKVPFIFGAISSAIGCTGERYGLSINAEEYNVFNQCIDTGVATSIENFWSGERAQQERRVSERFGYLAHELRSALGNAALAFKLLRAGQLAHADRTAAVLGNNLVRMETLVARTLGSVQLDADVPLQLRPVRVATVLRHLQASAIPERAIAITLELDESLYVNADEMLLTSAVSNLLHNAIKFSRAGARIALRCRAEEGGVVMEVEDQCGGLAAGDPARLFEPFVKGDEHPENLGLGLAITRRAAEAMNGRVSVEDHPGDGCTFCLTFPPARPNRISSPPPPPPR
jgi:signal transduction histidine kinase